MNLLSLSLTNQDEYHSYPAKGNRDREFLRIPRVVVLHVRWPEGYFTDKYPSLVISSYVYSVKGEPLTKESYDQATASTASTMEAGRNAIGPRSHNSKLGEAGRKG